MKQTFILSFLFSVLVQLSFAQPQKAADGIRQIMQKTPVMGISVAVVRQGKLVYTQAFGLKDAETNTPLSTKDVFRIASISKSFSATSVMQLVEKKKLGLDNDVSDLIGFKVRNPQFPETVITLRMLLSHTSSLNDREGYFTLDAVNPEKNPNWEKCYNNYEPGKGYQYCNLNFNIVGTIIERTSGERFDHYVKRHILDPLKLYGGYNVNELDPKRFATLYEYQTDSSRFVPSPAAYAPRKEEIDHYQMGYSAPVFSPTGGMKISAPDLARYMTMHLLQGTYKGKRIISPQSAAIMQTPLSSEQNYGLALWKTSKLIPGETLTGHTGSAYGLYSAMFFEPHKKFGIVVITNGCAPAETDGYVNVLREAVNTLYNTLIKN